MREAFRRGALVRIVGAATLIGAFWSWQADEHGIGAPAQAQPGHIGPTSEARLVLSQVFYGSTPSLAWSPDGQRLAFNAAYEYYGYDTQLTAHRADLGLWVYERDTESTRHLINEQRYHPAWIGDDLIASACSPYEDCTEGLFLTDLSGGDQHALTDSVYHTRAGVDGNVVFYNGFRGYTHWNRFDPATSARETDLSGSCSWEPPPELVVDQCVQTVGDVQVWADASGLWTAHAGGTPVQLDAMPAFSFSSSAWDCSEDHSGPVQPCLSPDARQVAFVASNGSNPELRVYELPEGPVASSGTGAVPYMSAPPEEGGAVTGRSPADSIAIATPEPLAFERRNTPATADSPSRAFLAFDLYGNTATLAWSPDGRRLAFNAAFQSSGYLSGDPSYEAVVDQLGLFVADLEGDTLHRVIQEQRYHPAWLDDTTLASACTTWDACTAGLTLIDMSGTVRTAREGDVMNTAPSPGQTVLYYDGMASTWKRYDASTDSVEPDVSSACLWEPPTRSDVDQCLQEVGDVRTWLQSGLGLYVQVGDADPIRLDPRPAWLYEGYAWGCTREEHSGPVGPCLSPDGSHVAYVTRGLTGLSVHVHEIPR